MKSKSKSAALFILTVAVIALVAYVGAFGLEVGGYRFKSFGETIKRGLDLTGGVSVVEEIQDQKVDMDKLQRAIDLIRLRINKLGVSENSVTQEGQGKIRIDVPGVYDTKDVIENVAKTGKLTFVDPDKNVILTGADIKDAKAGFNQDGKAVVNFQLTPEGTQKFADATQKFLGKTISIYMDEQEISSPTVSTVITQGAGEITGSKTIEDAKRDASIIKSGALPVTVKTASAKVVSATLGADALPRSIKGGLVGISLIFVFMIILYRGPGLLADIALVLYIVLVLAIYSVIGATLNLSGIAAFLLTVGMAVDANVLMFERVKEELRTGKSISSAVHNGYHKALSSILDSNITTAIAGIVLYLVGTGSVKGFALTLLIGIVVSLFTAIVVTRFLMNLAISMGVLNKVWLFGVKRGE